MLVSHRFKFIYTKTSKTAGTSVESYFESCCMPEGQWTPAHYRPEYVSDSGIIGSRGEGISGLKWWNHMPAEQIRHRVGEAVWSSYFKFCVIRNPFDKAISAFFYNMRNKQLDESHLPAQFEAWVAKGKLPIDRDKYVIDGRICVDDFIRTESLDADMQRVCERLGVPWEPQRLPRLKAEFRPASATAGRLYTPRSRAAVASAYAFELQEFGYEFPHTA